MAIAVSAFQGAFPSTLYPTPPSSTRRGMHHHDNAKGDVLDLLTIPSSDTNRHETIIRPVLLSTIAAASIFTASPPTAHAAADMTTNIVQTSHHSNYIISRTSAQQQQQHPMAMMMSSSSLHLSSSTLANPIGEVQDNGSDTGSSVSSVGTSFGQWFFLLYVVVSLLAGGKEMLGRIQKQMDSKDS